MNKCVLCGSDLVDGKCPNASAHFTAMCLNCVSCMPEVNDTQEEVFLCINKDNQKMAIEKIKQSVPSGYEIEDIKLKPLPLKDVTKKCKKWQVSKSLIEQEIVTIATV